MLAINSAFHAAFTSVVHTALQIAETSAGSADKFNALNDQSKKLEAEKAQVLEQFNIKNSQYAELVALVQEEEGVETPSEVVE